VDVSADVVYLNPYYIIPWAFEGAGVADVFISYSKHDRVIAEALADDLKGEGFDVWWDFELYAGDDFHEIIRAEIGKAKAVLVIWSQTAVASSWVRGEAQEADYNNKLISTSAPGFDARKVPINFLRLRCEPVLNRVRIIAAIRRKGVAAAAPRDPLADRPPVDPARLPDLAEFREAPFAPEMVVIPAGEFLMGSDNSDGEAYPDEKMPDGKKRKMVIPERFALGKYPVTFEEYDLFCAAEKRKPPPDQRGWGRDRRPVINVSWDEANAYADWLNERLGVEAYGLPSEAQWEYTCRAGTNTRYWWGDDWDPTRANGAQLFEGARTSPVGHYGDKGENPFHLSDMIGNVWEWCADSWTEQLKDLPPDGRPYGPQRTRARNQQNHEGNSSRRALRGGSWFSNPRILRSAVRNGGGPGIRGDFVGFRLSRTL
jgi:formylglycine-generating enzyme required for sulfatase activity